MHKYFDILFIIVSYFSWNNNCLEVVLLLLVISCVQDVINLVEKVFCVNSLINPAIIGNSVPVQNVSRSALLPSNSTIPDASTSDSVANENTLEISLSRALSEEALDVESLQLSTSIDISEQNLQKPGVVWLSVMILHGAKLRSPIQPLI